jgi:hypothetical protein
MIKFLKDIFKHKVYDIDPKIILDATYFKSFCERKDLKDIIRIYQEEENHNEVDFDINDCWQDFIEWLKYHLAYIVYELKHIFKNMIKEGYISVCSNTEEYNYCLYEENSNAIKLELSIDNIDWIETYRVNLMNYDTKKILFIV